MRLVLYAVPGIAAALISWLLTPLVRRFALGVGAVDRPAARKIHAVPTPRLGGLAVVVAAAFVLLVVGSTSRLVAREALWLGVGLGLLPVLVVSMVDDVRRLGARWKFLGQLAGAVLAVSFGVCLAPDVHVFGHAVNIGAWAWPISILWLIGVTNAFNLVDGLDGLSAGLALISAASLSAVFVMAHQMQAAVAAMVLAGAILGFLPHNVHPARIFLGDTGATAIGFTLACLSLRGGSTISAGFATLLPLIVLGVPVADTLLSMLRRLLRGVGRDPQHMFVADRGHVHHRLLDLVGHRAAVHILHAAGICLALAGLVSVFMTAQEAGLLLVGLLLAGFVGVARLGYQEFGVIRSGLVLRFYDAPVLHRSLFVVFLDLAFVAVSVYAAVGLKYDDWALLSHRPLAIAMASVLLPSTVAVLWSTGVYKGSWRLAGIHDAVLVSAAVALATMVGFLLLRPVTALTAPLSVFLVFALVKVAVANAARLSFKVLDYSRSRASAAGTRTVIYGAGVGGASALREMLSNPETGMRPVGFIDDDPSRAGRAVNGVRIVGGLAELEAALRRLRAETVVVSTVKLPPERVRAVRTVCKRAGARLIRMQIRFDEVRAQAPPRCEPAESQPPAEHRAGARAGATMPALAERQTGESVA